MKRREVYEHNLSATGRDIQMDPQDPEEGVWIERRTKRGYEPVMKAKILNSDHGRVEFTYDSSLPPRKYLIAGLPAAAAARITRWSSAVTKLQHRIPDV